MTEHRDEAALVAEANRVLGVDDVQAAGLFGLADLAGAMIAGSVAGSAVGDLAGAGGGVAEAAGAGFGAWAATRAAAQAKGMDVMLILAVTPQRIAVLNGEDGDQPPGVVAEFDRSSCQVRITKLGLSRTVELADPATGRRISLHGTVSPLMGRARADKSVLGLLAV